MRFGRCHRSSEPSQPREQPLHDPATLVEAQGSAVLRLALVLPVGRDHFDAVFLFEISVQRIGIIQLIADQSRHQFVERMLENSKLLGYLFLVRSGRPVKDWPPNLPSSHEWRRARGPESA